MKVLLRFLIVGMLIVASGCFIFVSFPEIKIIGRILLALGVLIELAGVFIFLRSITKTSK